MRRPARLDAFACARGHTFLHAHEACPLCGAPQRPRSISPHALLTLATVSYVTPHGEPVGLGIAVTLCGRARILCRVEGGTRGHGYDRVVVERVGDVFVAATGRSRARRPTATAGRKS